MPAPEPGPGRAARRCCDRWRQLPRHLRAPRWLRPAAADRRRGSRGMASVAVAAGEVRRRRARGLEQRAWQLRRAGGRSGGESRPRAERRRRRVRVCGAPPGDDRALPRRPRPIRSSPVTRCSSTQPRAASGACWCRSRRCAAPHVTATTSGGGEGGAREERRRRRGDRLRRGARGRFAAVYDGVAQATFDRLACGAPPAVGARGSTAPLAAPVPLFEITPPERRLDVPDPTLARPPRAHTGGTPLARGRCLRRGSSTARSTCASAAATRSRTRAGPRNPGVAPFDREALADGRLGCRALQHVREPAVDRRCAISCQPSAATIRCRPP